MSKTTKAKAQTGVKLVCGHVVTTRVSRCGDVAWCPICKRELFTGWPGHMEKKADLARSLKDRVGTYLDHCAEKGVQPSLSKIMDVCESLITASAFGEGYEAGGAIDVD